MSAPLTFEQLLAGQESEPASRPVSHAAGKPAPAWADTALGQLTATLAGVALAVVLGLGSLLLMTGVRA